MSDNIVSHIGTFNGYIVTTESIVRRFYVKKTERVNGEEKTKTFPVKIARKNVILNRWGATVVLSAYIHAGQKRYADSRDKGGNTIDTYVVAEMQRMLWITEHEARTLLKLD